MFQGVQAGRCVTVAMFFSFPVYSSKRYWFSLCNWPVIHLKKKKRHPIPQQNSSNFYAESCAVCLYVFQFEYESEEQELEFSALQWLDE